MHRHLESEGRLEDDEHRAEVTESSTKAFKTQIVLDTIAEAEKVQVSQDELTQYLVQGAAQYGMDPNEFVQVLSQNGQIPAMVGEVARNKALAIALGKANVTDAAGNAVDLSEFTAVAEADETEADAAAEAPVDADMPAGARPLPKRTSRPRRRRSRPASGRPRRPTPSNRRSNMSAGPGGSPGPALVPGREQQVQDWRQRVDAVWAAADALGDDEVIRRIDELAAERPTGDPVALFERAGARDSAGFESEAEPLYREALSRGLDGSERVQAHISSRRRSGTSAVRSRRSSCSTRSSPSRASSATRSSASGRSRSSMWATRAARHPRPSPRSLRTWCATACRSRHTRQSSAPPPRANSPVRVCCTG